MQMPLMLGRLYDALRDAKVPDALAREAAEEVAVYENRVSQVERDLTLLKWMAGANLAITLIVLGRVLIR